jgi:hypothetical protein
MDFYRIRPIKIHIYGDLRPALRLVRHIYGVERELRSKMLEISAPSSAIRRLNMHVCHGSAFFDLS